MVFVRCPRSPLETHFIMKVYSNALQLSSSIIMNVWEMSDLNSETVFSSSIVKYVHQKGMYVSNSNFISSKNYSPCKNSLQILISYAKELVSSKWISNFWKTFNKFSYGKKTCCFWLPNHLLFIDKSDNSNTHFPNSYLT